MKRDFIEAHLTKVVGYRKSHQCPVIQAQIVHNYCDLS